MSQTNIKLTVFGQPIPFRPSADLERVQRAIDLVEERFDVHQSKYNKGQAKDLLMIFMALELADELLQARQEQADMRARMAGLLAKIEKSI